MAQHITITGETLIRGCFYFLRRGDLELNNNLLFKSKPAPIGTVHIWKDKKQHRKTANGWVDVVRQRIKQPRGKETKGYFTSSYDRRLYNHYKAFFKDKDVKTSFKNYKEYIFKKFLSSSTNTDNAIRYLRNAKNQKEGYVPVLFIITSKKGRDISNYRIHPDNTEVLFEPFAKFKIVDIQLKEEHYEIIIKEI